MIFLKINYFFYYVVLNLNKLGKVRVVFDVVVKYEGMLLNENLFQGLDMINNLVGVLMRFR